MEENYGVAAFRSRQQVYAFHDALKSAGIPTGIVSTPRSISVGCGLSVRFETRDLMRVRDIYQARRPGNLIGFYRAHYDGFGRVVTTPLGLEMGYHG